MADIKDVVFAAIDQECAICMDRYTDEDTVSVTPCGHPYHSQCIGDWHKSSGKDGKSKCPTCKSTYLMNDLVPKLNITTTTDLQEKENVIVKLEDTMKKLKEQKKSIQNGGSKLRSQEKEMKPARDEHNKLTQENVKLTQKNASLIQSRDGLQRENQRKIDSIEREKNEVLRLKGVKKEKENKKKSLQVDLENAQSNEEQERMFKDAQENLSRREKELDIVKAKLSISQKTFVEDEVRLLRDINAVKNQEGQLNTARETLEKTKGLLSDTQKRHQATYAELQNEKGKLENLQKSYDETQTSLDKASQDLEKSSLELCKAKSEHSRTKELHAETCRRVKDNASDLAITKLALDEARNEMSSLKEAVKEAQCMLKQLEERQLERRRQKDSKLQKTLKKSCGTLKKCLKWKGDNIRNATREI